MSAAPLAERLLGAWVLESYETRAPDGTVREPFGPAPSGLLLYCRDGRMAVQAMDPRRPRWGSDAPEAQRRAQLSAAAEGYIAYTGTFEVEDGDDPAVVHHVENSLVPNWVGRPQRRAVSLERDRLRLTTPPLDVDGGTVVATLTWRR